MILPIMRINRLEQEISNLKHENTMLKGHLAMHQRRMADPEHEKRSAQRRKLAYIVVNERRGGFDRRQMMNGASGPVAVHHHPV